MSSSASSDLEARVTALEAKAHAAKTLDLSEKTFKTVLDADIHIDNKASRILTAIAFLTAATTAILNKAYSAPVAGAPHVTMRLGSLEVSLLSFSGFLLFVLVGAAFYLAALGPSLNVPDWFEGSSDTIKSLLFFELIGTLNQDAWTRRWGWQRETDKRWSRSSSIQDNLSESLALEMEQNFVYETWLIAQKARIKIRFMSFGSLLFKVGLVFLAPLVATLFSPDLKWGWMAFSVGILFLLLVLALESWQRPPFESNTRAMLLAVVAILQLVITGHLVAVW